MTTVAEKARAALGDLPEGWTCRRLRFDVRLNPKKSSLDMEPEELVSFVPMEAVGVYGGLKLDEVRELEEVYNGYTYFADGDLCIAKITPCFENGKSAIAEGLKNGVGFGTTELHIVRPGSNTDRRFLYYVSIADDFRKLGESEMYGAGGQKRIDESFIKDWMPPLPPLDTQRRIARFLDEKTARIDGLIEKKRALLDRLAEKRQALITRAVTKGLNPDAPMKPSGIDWLGAIPAHWEPVPLKRLGQVRSGITKGKSYSNEETVVLPYLRVANVQDGWLDLNEIAEIEVRATDVQKYALENGDILMNEGGDNDKLGRGAVWRRQIFPCLHQNHVFAVRLNALDPEWVVRCTEAAYAKFHFFRRAVQSTNLASISRTVVADLPIPLPPRDEIARILAALGLELGQMSEQMDKIDRTITLLAEYRSALITAVVTGQLAELR